MLHQVAAQVRQHLECGWQRDYGVLAKQFAQTERALLVTCGCRLVSAVTMCAY